MALAALPLLAVDVPRQSPEFTIGMPNGAQPLQLSSFKGKVVLIEFLFTTCPHCQNASKMISKLNAELGPKGFQPLGVAVNEMANMLVGDFVKNFGVNYPVGYSTRDAALPYLGISMMERWVVPQIVLIDRKGMIRMQSPPLGDEKLQTEEYLRTQIDTLLREGSGPATKKPVTKATTTAAKKAS